tara:strand:+ start:1874 stop:3112 length:1239 start_codon:yes stop_codon:yes gene_type:complete
MQKLKKLKGTGKKTLPTGGYAWIIGNGVTRKDKDVRLLKDYGILYACNWFYREEFAPHVLVASDEPMTRTILKTTPNWPRGNWFYTWFPKPGSGAKKIPTPEKFAAGPSACYIAAKVHEHKKIFLIGNDFFGKGSTFDVNNPDNNGIMNNLYEGKKHYAKVKEGQLNGAPTFRNWQRRYQWIIKQFPDTEFYHVEPFEGKSPPRLIGFDNFHQITWDNLMDHIQNDAELIDIKVITEEDKALAYGDNPDDIKAAIERQMAGQENVIYPDLMSPQDVLNLRVQAAKEQAKHGDKGKDVVLECEVQTPVGAFKIHVPWMGIKTPGGHYVYPTPEQQAAQFNKEMEDRMRLRMAFTGSENALNGMPRAMFTEEASKPRDVFLTAPPPPNLPGAQPIIPFEDNDTQKSVLPPPPII